MTKKFDMSGMNEIRNPSNITVSAVSKVIHDCGCMCHKHTGVMHCFPCCDFCEVQISDIETFVESINKAR